MISRHFRVYLVCVLTVFVSTVAFARPWDPLIDAAPNLIALYDASDSDTVITNTSATGNVLQWHDRSANGYHMSSVGGNRPTYGTNTLINGFKALYFDSTFDEMTTNGIPDINCTNVCMFAVGMNDLVGGDTPNYGYIYKTDNTDKFGMRANSGGNRLDMTSVIDGTNYSAATGSDASFARGIGWIAAWWYDGDRSYIRGNGGVISASADAVNGATFTINEIQCGRDSNTMKHYHGEMIVLDTADMDTIEKMEGYLAWKWGMEDKLPTDHPYKSAPPDVPPPGTVLTIK